MVTARTQKDLVETLKKDGFIFNEFTLEQVGRYTISDADWNYKDIPHLNVIHSLVDGYPAMYGDEFSTLLLVQKIFGLRFPMVLFNYQSGKNRQSYIVSLLAFLLIVETTYEALEPLKTKVITKYCVGTRGLFRFLFPLVRFVIRRNFKVLMSKDAPMRERRGELRIWGYAFKGDSRPSYSFAETTRIFEANVIPPEAYKESRFEFKDVFADIKDGEARIVGRSDHLGLRIVRSNNELAIYPRMCPHEGANLDESPCSKGAVRCPWHGRMLDSLVTMSLGSSGEWLLGHHKIELKGGNLKITSRSAGERVV